MIRYFKARRFPNQKNRLFSLILCITAVDMVLDVISSLIIDRATEVPALLTYLVNGFFYFLQLLLPILMTVFSLSMTGHLTRRDFCRWGLLLLPGSVIALLLLFNPLTHSFFRVDPVEGYVRGPIFLYTYIVFVFYMAATFTVAFRWRRRLQKGELYTVCWFLTLVFLSMVVQFLIPALLISGVAIALAVILMYFTIQNPENMLDYTTGAFTYDAMLTFLRDRAQERSHLQLVALNINNMRRIFELLGNENGSLLLREICSFLQKSAPDSWVFRMRGSCFVVMTRRGTLCSLGDTVENRLRQPFTVGSAEVLVQATLCCAETRGLLDAPLSPEEAVSYLDSAFLQNERNGTRLQRITLGREFLGQIERSRTVEAALRTAIETGEGLEVWFQPLWSVQEQRYVSAEALLRFRHPTLGSIPPDEFVPLAESCGLVLAMDELVVRKTCEFIRNSDPCGTLGIRTVEINLSALELMQRKLPELLDGILRQYGVNPDCLIFEVTETAAMESYELLQEGMTELCRRGCRFALDDFGTGYANISKVIKLPFSMVKLDRTLLLGPDSVLEDIARMFARMDRLLVIEGVETAKQAALVQCLPIDYIQGFYYARPMEGTRLVSFLREEAKQN